MSESVIHVENLAKRYRIGARREQGTLRDALTQTVLAPFKRLKSFGRSSHRVEDSIWALRDVSFDAQPGEVLGIIGGNGAGKTTLLKVLSRITDPTQGRAVLRGRVGSLLEVGAGFHGELTGRENIYLSGAILGMKKAETDARFEEIVDFSGIEQFLDTPVKRYSSGMFVRLGFAVAAHLDTEILLVDEVLAVGDLAFHRKCVGKMEDVGRTGRTVLFVSHNLGAVQNLTDRCLLIRGGLLADDGPTERVVAAYLEQMATHASVPLRDRTDRTGGGRAVYTNILCGEDVRQPTDIVRCGQPLCFELSYEADADPLDTSFAIDIYSDAGVCVLHCSSSIAGARFGRLPRNGVVTCVLPRCPLTPGRYYVSLSLHDRGVRQDWVQNAAEITVMEGDYFGTGRAVPGRWALCVTEQKWTAR